MSEHTMSEIPATPMDAVKQIYEIFQTRENFTTRVWARNHRGREVTPNDADACCWCLSGAVFHVYNLDADIRYNLVNMTYEPSYPLAKSVMDTFMLLWEKVVKLKISLSYIRIDNYINGLMIFNDTFGYTEVMRLLQAIIDDTEYTQEA